MFLIAFRNLIQEKVKLIISLIGVALSVLLVMVLLGVYQGLNTKLGEYIKTIPADLWLAQEGSKNLYDSTSILSASAQEQIETIDGVKSVKTFIGRQISVEINSEDKRTFVIGLGGESGARAPKVLEGTTDIGSGEIILDRSITGVALGQAVKVGGENFTVAGITEGGNVLIVTYAFVTNEDAIKLFKLTDVVNYFIVETEPGADQLQTAKEIEAAVPGTTARNGPDFVENSISVIREVFLPIISVLALIGIAVGITVIGLTIFTSTIEKAKEYGVLKAIGMRNGQLYKIVLQQSLLTSFFGYLAGAGLAIGLTKLVLILVPEFVSYIRPVDALLVFTATLIMGILAAILPAHRISKIDPAEVFKA